MLQDPAEPALVVIHSLIHHQAPRDGSDQWFRLAGVVHLYSASGIHLLALLYWIERSVLFLGLRSRLRAEWLHVIVWLAFAAVAGLVWKAEGFHFSLVRPILSILLRRWIRLSGRTAGRFVPLGLVLLVEWIFTRSRGWSPGAMHYYLAVGGSLVALAGTEGGFLLHFRMAVYSWVPLAVLELCSDRYAAPLTPLLSLLTIPPVAFVLYPLTLFSLAWSGQVDPLLLKAWGVFLSVLAALLDWAPVLFRVNGVALGSGLLFAALLWRYRRDPRILGVLPMLWILRLGLEADDGRAPSPGPPNRVLNRLVNRVVQLDVGQGDSTLIQKSGRNELVDTGSGRAQGPERWVRMQALYGADAIDGILLTHLDEDHSGGLRALLAVLPAGCIEVGRSHQSTPEGRRLAAWLARDFPNTRILDSGCIRMSKVAWFRSGRSGAAGNRWMAGIVHRLGNGLGYLALGDGDWEQERGFYSRFQRDIGSLRRKIWKAGHHGSKFSSDPEFLQKLGASEIWISVGRKNRYGHPAQEALSRLGASGSLLRRTDQEGDLVSTE